MWVVWLDDSIVSVERSYTFIKGVVFLYLKHQHREIVAEVAIVKISHFNVSHVDVRPKFCNENMYVMLCIVHIYSHISIVHSISTILFMNMVCSGSVVFNTSPS